MENDEEYMKDLYERFRSEVMAGRQPEFYDKDELLDIYDYAQDEGDVMTQFQVFLAASRQYPDAESFMGERMGFFVSYIDGRAGIDMLDRKGREDTPLWEVLRMSINAPERADLDADLGALLQKYESFDSESVIKLIDLLREVKRTDLLGKYSEILMAKAEDKRGTAFEISSSLLDGNNNLETAQKLAEGLTEQEPFNCDNWLLLSKINLSQGRFTDSVSAADYALAINPESRGSQALKALAQIGDGVNTASGINSLEQLFAQDPADVIVLRGLVHGYTETDRKSEAVEAFLKFWETNPLENFFVFPDLLRLEPDDSQLVRACELFYKSAAADEDRWIQLAALLESEGMLEYAASVLEFYDTKETIVKSAEYLILLYYKLKRYNDLAEYFSACCHKNDKFRHKKEANSEETTDDIPYRFSMTTFLLFAAASLLRGDYETALTMASMMISNPPAADEIDDRIRMAGVLKIARDIRRFADHPTTIPAGFDPLMRS